MKKGLRWKIVLTVAVLAVSVFMYLQNKIHLGLDLKGGVHLVMQIMTEDAVRMDTDQNAVRLQDAFKKNAITFTSIVRAEGPGKLSLQGLNPDQEGKAREQLDLLAREWDYTFNGTSAAMTMKAVAMQQLREQAVDQSVETIRNRIDQFGVAEPIIQRYGRDQIIVELPGVDNPERVQDIIKTAAVLEWRLVKAGPAADEATLLQPFNGTVPEDGEVIKGDAKRNHSGFYLLSRVPAVTGKDLRNVRRSADEWNNPAVGFQLSPEGARRFEQVTGDNIGRSLAIVLDNKVQSAPNINARISDSGIIQGGFSVESADDLVLVLRSGALPAGIKTLENRTIGPSLGADSIR
ncbi:MAG: protein translocase subunit SecD, partial [Candidatus Aminicenantales bacterium]